MPSLPEVPRNRRAGDEQSDLAALSRLAGELSGTLRPPSITRRLMSALDDYFKTTASALSLYDINTDRLEIMHGTPPGAPYLQDLLDAGMRRGPLILDATSIPGLPEDAPRTWLASPIVSRSVIIGSLALGRDEPPLAQEDLNLLRAFIAEASLALESARLVDQVESGKRTWAEAVDAIPLPLCIIDRAGRVRRSNLRFTELMGVPPESMTGRPWRALVPPSWREGISRVLELGVEDVELRMESAVWRLTAWPAGPPDQGITILLFEDHQRQQQLEEQLLQSQKLASVGQLVAGVAHDLNNPLASVLGFADFLSESPDVPDHLREPVRVIQEEAVRASHIVKNLLGFARKRDGSRRDTEVGVLVEGTMALLRNHLLEHHVEVSVEIEDDLPPVFVHANRIQQALINLLTNAAHAVAATHRAGTIEIRATSSGDGVMICVTDSGVGIPPDVVVRIFEPFYTTKRDDEGTGLGLHICREIIEDNGGEVTVESRPGAGSTFCMTLPRGESDGVPAAASRDSAPSDPGHSPPLRILLIDDEPHILHYLRTTLETWGHQVMTAADGVEGLDRASANHFDLIISDLRMPRLGGREFYEALSSRDPDMASRLVFSTGDTVRGDTMEFLAEEGRPYLNKPFSLAELRDVLHDAHIARVESGSGSTRE